MGRSAYEGVPLSTQIVFLEQKLRELQEWHDPADKLPPIEMPVLVLLHGQDAPVVLEIRTDTGDPFQGEYYGTVKYWDSPMFDGADIAWDSVACWMYLPETPEMPEGT